jgi:cardiolipin synthase A/B
MSRSIIVLPDDSTKPILDAVANAEKSIRIKMFIFSDPSLLQALIAAQHRGVDDVGEDLAIVAGKHQKHH